MMAMMVEHRFPQIDVNVVVASLLALFFQGKLDMPGLLVSDFVLRASRLSGLLFTFFLSFINVFIP